LKISADDFGLTYNTSLKIIDGCKNGVINSTSIIANGYGYGYDQSIKLLKDNLHLIDTSVHINLCEGAPISGDAAGTLLSKEGLLHLSFQSLWKKIIFI